MQAPNQAMTCPMCRQESDVCFLELETASRMPIGFYRKTFMARLPVPTSTKTTFVKVLESGRDLAQSATMSMWLGNEKNDAHNE